MATRGNQQTTTSTTTAISSRSTTHSSIRDSINNKVRFSNGSRPQQQQQPQRDEGVRLRQSKKSSMDSGSDGGAPPSMYDTSTSESWSTSEGRTHSSYHSPLYSYKVPSSTLASSQDYTSYHHHHHRPLTSSSLHHPCSHTLDNNDHGVHQPQVPKRSLPSTTPSASPNTSMSSAATKLHQNSSHRRDLTAISTNSIGQIQQHSFSSPTASTSRSPSSAAAMSEPGTSNDRFNAYLSRLATFDPRTQEELQQALEAEIAQRRRPEQTRQPYSSSSSPSKAMSDYGPSRSNAAQSTAVAAALAQSTTTTTSEKRDSTPNRSRAERRARLERLSTAMHLRSRSVSRSETPSREAQNGNTPSAGTAPTNKQVGWKSLEYSPQSKLTVATSTTITTTSVSPSSADHILHQLPDGRAFIETPSPAKVEEIKRQLWSEDEQLKNWTHTAIGSNTNHSYDSSLGAQQPQPRRQAKSLSPQRPQYRKKLGSERVAATFTHATATQSSHTGTEFDDGLLLNSSSNHPPSGSNGGLAPGSAATTPKVFKSRFYAAAIAAHRCKEPLPAPPLTPSVVAASGNGYETKSAKSQVVSPSMNRRLENMANPSTAGIPASSGLLTDTNKATTPATKKKSSERQHHHHQSKDSNSGSMWREVPHSPPSSQQQVSDSIPIIQSSSTGMSDNHVAKLVARLNAVRRDNPSAALAQIDAILRAESVSSSQGDRQDVAANPKATPNASKTEPKEAKPKHYGIVQDDEEESDEDGSSSEDETTVSSITNPTFQSARRDRASLLPLSSLAGALPANRNPEAHGYATPYTMPVQPPQQSTQTTLAGTKTSKSKKTKANPPPSIRVTSPKNATESTPQPNDGVTNEEEEAEARRLDKFIKKQQNSTAVDPSNPNALAEKIRVWDEMSNPSLTQNPYYRKVQSAPTSPMEEVLSNATEELGSIITPADQATSVPFPSGNNANIKLTGNHPWDNHHPNLQPATAAHTPNATFVMTRDTSMIDGEGIETQTPQQQWRNQAGSVASDDQMVAQTSRKETKPASAPLQSSSLFDIDDLALNNSIVDDSFEIAQSQQQSENSNTGWDFTTAIPQHQVNAMSLSDDFDNAWVALPPNAFSGRRGGAMVRASPPDATAALPATSMFTANSMGEEDNTKEQLKQQPPKPQEKASALPPEVTAAFDLISLNTETLQPREKSPSVISQKAEETNKPEPSEEPDRHIKLSPLLAGDPWLFSSDKDLSGESHRSAGIEVSLLESPPPSANTSTKPKKNRLGFLRPILNRGRAGQAAPAAAAPGDGGGAYDSLSPTIELKQAADAMKRSPQRDQFKNKTAFTQPRGRANSWDEGTTLSGTKLRTRTLASKLSRLMKVYDDRSGF